MKGYSQQIMYGMWKERGLCVNFLESSRHIAMAIRFIIKLVLCVSPFPI